MVSSAGMNRPIWSAEHFRRFAGEQVTLKLRVPLENRRKLTGQLVELADGRVKLIVDGREVSVDLTNVDAARLKPMV